MRALLLSLSLFATLPAQAQLTVTPELDHGAMLFSTDARLAANKRLVYDFWREVLEAHQLDRAPHYLHVDYQQHNPNVATGLAGFQDAFAGATPQPVQERIKAPLVAIVAERDLVMLSFVATRKDAAGAAYTTTWFDLFRVEGGKITEHWDGALKR